jgi:hypothetical protein
MLGLASMVLLMALILGGVYYLVRHRWPAAGPPAGADRGRRVRLLTEAAAITGACLVLAGAVVAIGERWRQLTGWEHVGIVAGAAVLFLAFGLVARRVSDPAAQRLAGPVWFGSAALAGTAAGIAAHEVARSGSAVTTLAVGTVVAAYSAVLWLISRQEPQLVTLFAGLAAAVCGTMLAVTGAGAGWLALTLGLWALGLGWAIVGWRYPEPLWTSAPLGVLLALVAPGFAVWQHGWVYAIGIGTAAAAMAASIPLRNVLLLAVGTFALIGYATAAVVRYFHATLGLAMTLAISGVLLLAVAAFIALLRPPRPPEPQQAAKAEHDQPPAPVPVG